MLNSLTLQHSPSLLNHSWSFSIQTKFNSVRLTVDCSVMFARQVCDKKKSNCVVIVKANEAD